MDRGELAHRTRRDRDIRRLAGDADDERKIDEIAEDRWLVAGKTQAAAIFRFELFLAVALDEKFMGVVMGEDQVDEAP